MMETSSARAITQRLLAEWLSAPGKWGDPLGAGARGQTWCPLEVEGLFRTTQNIQEGTLQRAVGGFQVLGRGRLWTRQMWSCSQAGCLSPEAEAVTAQGVKAPAQKPHLCLLPFHCHPHPVARGPTPLLCSPWPWAHVPLDCASLASCPSVHSPISSKRSYPDWPLVPASSTSVLGEGTSTPGPSHGRFLVPTRG